MKKLQLIALIMVGLVGVSVGQQQDLTRQIKAPSYTVSTLPSSPSFSSLAVVTDSTNGSCTTGGGTTRVVCYWNGSSWVALASAGFSVGSMWNGTLTNSLIVIRFTMPFPVTIPSGCTTSVGSLGTSATASTVFSLQKNGTQFGTMTFAASGTTATFSCASSTVFTTGDTFTLVAPASADATAGNLSATLYGARP